MKSFLTTLVVALFSAVAFSQNINPQPKPKVDHPNLVRVTYPGGGAYIHPSKLEQWLINEPLNGDVQQGQISICSYKGIVFATTAPIVTFNKLDFTLPGAGPWMGSLNKASISMVPITNPAKLGFAQAPQLVASPAHGKPATIRGALFSDFAMTVVAPEITGTLLQTADEKLIVRFKKAFGNSFSEFRLRLERAPTLPFLYMEVPADLVPYLRGMSGSSVWQEEHPVGILVAAVDLVEEGQESKTYAIIENLEAALISNTTVTLNTLKQVQPGPKKE